MYRLDRGFHRDLARIGHARIGTCRWMAPTPDLGSIAWASALIGVAAVLFGTQPAVAATCTDELQLLAEQWNAMSFPTPAKPAAHVLGKNGREYTGGQIEYMKTEIRLANIDCRSGNSDAAMKRVTIVRGILTNGYAVR
ncbi:MAG TPA: hypothetical protein VGU20_13800 [Stellaceae bacterium]|nr:hypothetical protein [Stellaceae bacterium]